MINFLVLNISQKSLHLGVYLGNNWPHSNEVEIEEIRLLNEREYIA